MVEIEDDDKSTVSRDIHPNTASGIRDEFRSYPEADNRHFVAFKNSADPEHGITEVKNFTRYLDQILELRCLLLANADPAELKDLISGDAPEFEVLNNESLLQLLTMDGGTIPAVSSEKLLLISQYTDAEVKHSRERLQYFTSEIVAALNLKYFQKIVFGEHKKVDLSSEDFRVFLLTKTLEALDRVKWNNSQEIIDSIKERLEGNFASGVNDVPTFRKCLKRILNIRCLLSAGIVTAKLDKLCGGEIDDSNDENEIDDSSESDEQDESDALSKSAASCKKSKPGKKREIEELAKLHGIFKDIGSGSGRSVVSELRKMLTAGEAIPAVSTETLIDNSKYSEKKLELFRARLKKSMEGISKVLNNTYFRKIANNSPHHDGDESSDALQFFMYSSVAAAMDRVSLKNIDQVVSFIAQQFKAQLGDGARRLENTRIVSEAEYFTDPDKKIENISTFRSGDPEERYLDNLDFVKARMFCARIERLAEFFKDPTPEFLRLTKNKLPKGKGNEEVNFENPKRYGSQIKKIASVSTAGSPVTSLPYAPTNYSWSESGYDYEVEFVKFIDGTRIADTAWSVTEEVLRELIALEWYLGAELTKARAVFGKRLSWEDGKRVALKLGARLPQPDLDLALITLERCADLLEGVLFRHDTKAYVLGSGDPLSVARVYELLGLIRAMITLFPGDNNTWEEHERTLPSYPDLVWPDDGSDECVDYVVDGITLQKIRELASCAKNAATGYCNTGFALCNFDDECDAAETAYNASDYLLVSQIYRKVLNQVSGFLKTYLVHGKNGILPIYKCTGHVQFNINHHKNANALRCEMWKDLREYLKELA